MTKNSRKRNPSGMFAAWLLLTICIGCSDRPQTYPIQGHAQFSDGTPVQFGEIETFQGDQKLNARGTINKDGSFQLGTFSADDGVLAGKHQVVITQFSATPLSGNVRFDTIEHDHGHQMDQKYRSYKTSPLTFEIIPGETKDITLTIDSFQPAKEHGQH